eukprot:TRINITY_DN5998_c0_g1_i2.p1 TRINITY_DN5998_c0_g1~~TRINITY_DN5998_c0_g1_i2.p1  ORF type:complete len:101 (+),score=6.04 TRINITY_DN5998_c0_g1_i2:258-560(+)
MSPWPHCFNDSDNFGDRKTRISECCLPFENESARGKVLFVEFERAALHALFASVQFFLARRAYIIAMTRGTDPRLASALYLMFFFLFGISNRSAASRPSS